MDRFHAGGIVQTPISTLIPKVAFTDEGMASLWNVLSLGSAIRGLGFRLSLDPATGAQDDRQVRQDSLTRENVMLRTATSRSSGSVAASAVTFWHRPGVFCLWICGRRVGFACGGLDPATGAQDDGSAVWAVSVVTAVVASPFRLRVRNHRIRCWRQDRNLDRFHVREPVQTPISTPIPQNRIHRRGNGVPLKCFVLWGLTQQHVGHRHSATHVPISPFQLISCPTITALFTA